MACSGLKKTKQCLTLKDKLEILKLYDSAGKNIKRNDLCKRLNISRSTLITTLNNRQSIEETPLSDQHRFRVRNKRENPYAGSSKYSNLEEKLAEWINEARKKGTVINGVVIKEKAKQLAVELSYHHFTASNGWSDRFKKKYNIRYKNAFSCYCTTVNVDKANESYLYDKLIEDTINLQNQRTAPLVHSEDEDFKLIENQLLIWLSVTSQFSVRNNKNILKEMALCIAGILGVTNFFPTDHWLNNFQKKYTSSRGEQCLKCK